MDHEETVSVAVIEARRVMREGLVTLIDGSPGFRCVGGFGSMEAALALLGRDVPDIALVDVGLPNMTCIEGIRRLGQSYPSVSGIVLTVYEDDERLFDCLCAGAAGYILKKTPPGRLIHSLGETIRGGAPMSPVIAQRIVECFHRYSPAGGAANSLTPNELRLLGLLVEGHNYGTIADELNLAVGAISCHMRLVYEKLQRRCRSEAVLRTLRSHSVG